MTFHTVNTEIVYSYFSEFTSDIPIWFCDLQVINSYMDAPLHLRSEHGVTLCTSVQFTFIAVFDSKVNLDVHFRVKNLLTQSAPKTW
jgi:hypothetical protein